ncbi:MAG: calcium/sodium antiporter [Caldilineaceae bacterium]|nr:calcium/sodium antiporter [Caldilineaceae bacterium]
MTFNSLGGNIFLFGLGFILLAGGAELLVRGSSRIALRFNVPAVVVGLTIVAFGTSLPELLVSLLANLQGEAGSPMAIGNIVGSNIANIGLILGVTGLLTAIPVDRALVRREIPLVIIVSLLFTLMAWPGSINRLNGLLLTAGLLAFTYYSYNSSRTSPEKYEEGEEALELIDPEITEPSRTIAIDLGYVILGIVALVAGANWLVQSAQFIARAMGVSELIIGLSLVAVGTSLPELATSIIAILRKEGDIAVGNIVGSNLFNMMFIGGIASLVRPLPVPASMRTLDLPVMVGFSVLLFLLVLRRPHVIDRFEAAVLLIAYATYMAWLFFSGNIEPGVAAIIGFVGI